jgi:hypothetical protein
VTKRITWRVPLGGATIDDLRMMPDGEINLWDDATQSWITHDPIAPELGQPIEITVVVRCQACGQVVGELQEWDHPSAGRVHCFIGRAFHRSPDGERIIPGTYHALLQPAYGTAPAAMCPQHGPVQVTTSFLRKAPSGSTGTTTASRRGTTAAATSASSPHRTPMFMTGP